MTCTLHDIERVCAAAPGGLASITLIVPDDVDTYPEQYCVPNVDDIVLLEGAVAYTIHFVRDTARLVDKQSANNAAGDTFDYTLTFDVRHIRLDVEWLRAKLANRRVHVIAEYRTGLKRLIPRMRVLSDSDSGDRIGAQQRYAFSLTASLSRPAPTIDSTLSGGDGGIVTPDPPPGLTITQTIIAPGDTVSIPAQSLIHAIVLTAPASPNTVKIGTTVAGDEIMTEETLPLGEDFTLNTAIYFSSAGTLYVTNSENCGIIVYLR